VKCRLEAKLLEFGSLVAELGYLQKPAACARRKSHGTAVRRAPEERQFRSALELQAVENAMLPTLAEDKCWTLGYVHGQIIMVKLGLIHGSADELRNILDEPDSQSPDLGPPPVSQFDIEEPIAFNPSIALEEQTEETMEDSNPALSINLETRKKRRESGPKLDMRRVSIFEPPANDPDQKPSRSVRTGAKRKFSVQEDDDRVERPDLQSEPFSFTRRNHLDASEDAASNNDTEQRALSRPVLSSSEFLGQNTIRAS
jgi:hypothetical protein